VSAFDLLVVVVIGASCLLGLLRGLLKELLSLVAYVLAFLAAVWWGARVAAWLEPWLEHTLIRMGVAYGLVFLLALLLMGLLNLSTSVLIEKTGLTPADRGLGLLFGLARGVLVVLVAVTLIGHTDLTREAWWQDAVFAKLAVAAVQAGKTFLPPALAAWIPY